MTHGVGNIKIFYLRSTIVALTSFNVHNRFSIQNTQTPLPRQSLKVSKLLTFCHGNVCV